MPEILTSFSAKVKHKIIFFSYCRKCKHVKQMRAEPSHCPRDPLARHLCRLS